MDRKDICRKIDYTLLKPTATYEDFYNLCAEAIKNECASVCIPSSYVGDMRLEFPSLNICTVVGFPLGNCDYRVKGVEASIAVQDGANEIDMVVNLSEIKNGCWNFITQEIETVRNSIGKNTILKVIIETCYLTEEEIKKVTQIVDESSANYIKTSTGFGAYGATFKDVCLISETIRNNTKIKASGGIRNKGDMETYLAMGCDRIGASTLPQ